MPDKPAAPKPAEQPSLSSVFKWRIAQMVVWLVGAAILFCLFFYQALGILLLWNILIPVAPALFVVGIGVWRNVCPLATTNLMPRHLGLSKRKKLSAVQMGRFNLVAVVALFIIVPLRHAIFNANGIATGLLLISMATISIIAGLSYEWKSAWCSGLCPIHPVEKLYGGNVLFTVPNAHCDRCMNCVVPCPDSTPNINPKSPTKTGYHKISGVLITGGLPGFIWGWFHLSDYARLTSWGTLLGVYAMPLLGLITTLTIYILLLLNSHKPKFEKMLTGIFAALSVACYYWYRIPALLGFGKFGTDGLLINLHDTIPEWSVSMITAFTTFFFFYWLVIRKRNKKSWLIRPEFADKRKRIQQKLPA